MTYTDPPAFKELVKLLPPSTNVEIEAPLSIKILEVLIFLGVFVVASVLVALVMYLCTRPANTFLGRVFFWDHVEQAVEPANEQFVQIVLNNDVEANPEPTTDA